MKKLMCLLLLFSMMLSSCSETSDEKSLVLKKDPNEFKEDTVFAVGTAEVSYPEVYLYLQSVKEEMEALFGTAIWEVSLDQEKRNMEEALKEDIKKRIVYTKVVCSKAEELGISLSEDELIDASLYTEDYITKFTPEAQKNLGITAELVKKIYQDRMLANKVYETLTLNVDTDVAEESIRYMVLQYVMAMKYTRDANGQQKNYTVEELKEVKQKMEALLKTAAAKKGLASLTELESNEYMVTELIANKEELIEKLSVELAEPAFGLRKGELSGVIETDLAYVILFCAEEVDNEATETAKIAIIEQRQKELFDSLYKKWEKESLVTINRELWNSISW